MRRAFITLGIAAAASGLYLAAVRGETPAPLPAQAPAQAGAPAQPSPSAAPKSDAPGQRVEVPPPPFSEGIFPCSGCHSQLTPNRTRSVLTDMHQDIVLKHDEEHRWCLDCHDAADRDKLHLASGELVPFDESYRLCGQCHGEKYRDWRAGVHGRRSGYWNGQKTYYLCVNCHNPHSPRFKPLKPEPRPARPEEMKR